MCFVNLYYSFYMLSICNHVLYVGNHIVFCSVFVAVLLALWWINKVIVKLRSKIYIKHSKIYTCLQTCLHKFYKNQQVLWTCYLCPCCKKIKHTRIDCTAETSVLFTVLPISECGIANPDIFTVRCRQTVRWIRPTCPSAFIIGCVPGSFVCFSHCYNSLLILSATFYPLTMFALCWLDIYDTIYSLLQPGQGITVDFPFSRWICCTFSCSRLITPLLLHFLPKDLCICHNKVFTTCLFKW